MLLEPCAIPNPQRMETNGDLARYASELMLALEACAAKLDSVRAFYGEGNGVGDL